MESQGYHEFLFGLEEYLINIDQPGEAVKTHSLAAALSEDSPIEPVIKLFFQQCTQDLSYSHIHLADLIHKFSKAVEPEEFKHALLHFLMQRETIDKSLKDLIHKFTKTTSKEDSHSALLIYIMQKSNVDSYLKDFIHKVVKAELKEHFYNSLLLYTTNQDDVDTHLKDFIFKVAKQLEKIDYQKNLLQYLTKELKDKTLINLAHSLYKSSNKDTEFAENFVRTHVANLERENLGDKFFRGINSCIKNNLIDQNIITDAFSRSQIKSKFWLVNELIKIKKDYGKVVVMAGWFGQIKSIYEKSLTYKQMRILDTDQQSCYLSDYVFNLSNLENYKVKSVCADINSLILHENGYQWSVENFKEGTSFEEKFLPNLIINTSAEHMSEEWFHQIRFKNLKSNPIVAIQSNNMFGIEEHVNCVHSVDHMKKKFPMQEILFEGELQLKGYKRVMLIGRP